MILTTTNIIKMVGPLFIVGFVILIFGFARALFSEMRYGFNLKGREEAKKKFLTDIKGFSTLLVSGYIVFLGTILLVFVIGQEYVKYFIILMALGVIGYVALKLKRVRQQAFQ